MLFRRINEEKRPVFPRMKTPPAYLLEILLIILWALWVGRSYLNFDPKLWPLGREFGLAVHSHYIWQDLFECGTCIFWNGSIRGGAPAFAELQGSVLHPFVIVSTLLYGVVNGSKVVLLSSLIIAGLAQWWLAKRMQVGWLARLWTAGMAVVGGHLAGRMELGLVGMVLSTAMCSLAIAAAVDLALSGKRRSAVGLGIILSLVILSGQGYMQIGFLVAIVPALIVFVFDCQWRLKPIWKEFLLSAILALLLSGVFLVPVLHFMPNIDKFHDSTFRFAQLISNIPLNLVINDEAFYRSLALQPAPYPNLYVTYLGWIPVLLAVLAFRFAPRNSNRVLGFILLGIVLSYLAASGIIFKGILGIYQNIDGVRFPSFIAGLANPLVLCMAALGVDGILKLKLPRLAFLNSDQESHRKFVLNVNTAALILIIPLVISLKSAYEFGHNWLGTITYSQESWEITQVLRTDRTEWINTPVGEHFWYIATLDERLKTSNVSTSQVWRGREIPPVYLDAARELVEPNNPKSILSTDSLNIIKNVENEYAYILSGDQNIPCVANAVGGFIDVSCPDTPAGTLMVIENNWQGWNASRDQARTPLLVSAWLSVEAPSGVHNYSFRYKPWDVWVGFFLMLCGIVLSIYLWIKTGKSSDPPPTLLEKTPD